MAEKKYSAVLTEAGEVALAEAALSGLPVGFALMASVMVTACCQQR